MDKFAQELLIEHKNPIVKFTVKTQKFNKVSDENNHVLNEIFEEFKRSISTNRVDRRCARSKLKWLEKKQKIESLKLVGSVISSYGFHEKAGKFFHPEEALFLLEMNKAEILWNNVPFTIEKAFEVFINKNGCTFNMYRGYKKLCLEGYKITRPLKTNEEDSSHPCKRFKKDDNQENELSKLLKKLQENSPQTNFEKKMLKYDYLVCKTKKKTPDFKLSFLNSTFNEDIGFYNETNLYCYAKNSDLSFLSCSSIDLPNLV